VEKIVPTLTVAIVASTDELRQALAVRTRVFVEEQGVPVAEEIDSYDRDPATNTRAVHFIGRLGGEPVATARLLLDAPAGEFPHIGRVAVVPEHRGRGYGRAIMAAVQAEAAARGFAGVTLAAQLQALPFYERLGYVARGSVFLDAGIEHRLMDLLFEQSPE
jgi:predicted GNAT family N-acyltransferase